MKSAQSLKSFGKPEYIFSRLKYLCHEKRKDILEEHCGVYDLSLDEQTRKNARLGAKRLRCSVLDIDDIFLYVRFWLIFLNKTILYATFLRDMLFLKHIFTVTATFALVISC